MFVFVAGTGWRPSEGVAKEISASSSGLSAVS